MWKCSQCGCENAAHLVACSRCGATAVPGAGDGAALTGELLRLLAEGKKLEAVKCYKDRTGASLMVAKNAVEALQGGGSLPQFAGAASQASGDLSSELRRLLQQGKKLQAVKLYKDQTGASLMDAKKAVEALESDGAAANSLGADDPLAREILSLLRMGEKKEAVRVYERRTGVGHEAAKRAVLALARQNGGFDRSSAWLRTALLLLTLLIAALLAVGGIIALGK
jgi:ribosomal protein L7/L12